jgi:hypothetical protein
MVMLLRGCSAGEAFAVLVAVSQQSNVKLRDVATVVVATGSATERGLADPDAERAVRAALCEHMRRDLGTGEAGRRPAAGSAKGFVPRRFSSRISAPGVSGTKSLSREYGPRPGSVAFLRVVVR